jgi:transcriptional regulator with XRE-family HTH domain
MQIKIASPGDLGLLVRAVRRSAGLRLDDLASIAKVSKQFGSNVELGKQTVRLDLVFKLLAELGIPMTLEIPSAAEAELLKLRNNGGRKRSLKPRKKPPDDEQGKSA